MVVKQNQESEKLPLLPEHGHAKVKATVTEVKDEEDRLSMLQKLALNAALFSNEASCNFEHLYTVPLLQTLGLPLRLSTLTGAFSGPLTVLVLPLLGWFSDRGSNPLCRKFMSTILTWGIVFTGQMCILTANMLHMRNVLTNDANRSGEGNKPYDYHEEESGSTQYPETLWQLDSLGLGRVKDDMNGSSLYPVMTDVEEDGSVVSLKAGLAMLGFVLMDLGVDGTCACVRSCVLTCGRRSDHTPLLTVGLILASLGGVTGAAMGLLNLPSVLGLTFLEDAGLSLHTTIQLATVVFFMIVCLPITLLTVRRLHTLRDFPSEDATHISKASNSRSFEEDSLHLKRPSSRSVIMDAFESSIRSLGSGATHFEHSLGLLGELQRSQTEDRQRSTAERSMPLLQSGDIKKVDKEEEELLERSPFASMSVSYKKRGSLVSITEHAELIQTSSGSLSEKLPGEESLRDVAVAPVTDAETEERCSERRYRLKMLLIALSTYFSASDIFLFTLTSSDFVGKVIYHGDPAAPPGSQSLANYEEGVRMTSLGFFIYFASFLVSSFLQPRILIRIGYRAEYALAHVLMAVMMVAVSATEMLEVFYLLTTVAGIHRACIFTVPFAAINDLVQSRASESSEDGKKQMGFGFSLVMSTMAMSYCSIFTSIGPLEELTGIAALPFWVASVTSLLSTGAFLAIEKV